MIDLSAQIQKLACGGLDSRAVHWHWFAMKYAVTFAVAGALFVVLATTMGGTAWLLVWPAFDLFLLAGAYGLNRPDWLGKRPDGRMEPVRAFVFAPYLVLTWLCWAIYVRVVREAWSNEVAPNIWVGRRPSPKHLPDGALVVDLTAEFPVHPEVRDTGRVICLPTLDARSPGSLPLRELASELANRTEPLYVHCAQGHGRSATVASVVMVMRGHGETIDEAMAKMAEQRPLVHLHSVQQRDAEAAVQNQKSGPTDAGSQAPAN